MLAEPSLVITVRTPGMGALIIWILQGSASRTRKDYVCTVALAEDLKNLEMDANMCNAWFDGKNDLGTVGSCMPWSELGSSAPNVTPTLLGDY